MKLIFLAFSGYPVVNDPLYNHDVFGPEKGKGGRIGKSDEDLIQDLISIHNAENWLGMDQDDLIICNPTKKVTVTHHQQPSSQPPQRADTPDSAVAISDHSPSSSSPASDFQVRLFHDLWNSTKNVSFFWIFSQKRIFELIFQIYSYWLYTVRNLHFFSKNSTLISRENCRFFWLKNSWKCCGFGLFSCWPLWFHEKNCQKILGEKLVKMLGFCRNLIFGQKFDFSNSVYNKYYVELWTSVLFLVRLQKFISFFSLP